MKKAKKRSNSFSKFQKGILFVLVLVAASLIGFTMAAVTTGKNPFQFLFSHRFGTKEENSKLKSQFIMDEYIDGRDLTESFLLNKNVLIARNGATNIPDAKNPNEAYVSQFLHELYLKNGINVNGLGTKIKNQANVDVELKFFLVPKVLQNKDPKEFLENGTVESCKLLDLSDFQYEELDDNEKPIEKKNYFGSYIVFNNEIYDGLNLKYKYDWIYEKTNSPESQFSVTKLTKTNTSQTFFPKQSTFTTEELKSRDFLQNQLNNDVNNSMFDPAPSYSSSKNVTSRADIVTMCAIPDPTYIETGILYPSTRNFDIYQPVIRDAKAKTLEIKYPKLILKRDENDYIKTKAYILINFWNEMALNNDFFQSDDVRTELASKGVDKDYYSDDKHDLTLFVQVTYNLVDDKGDFHTFATTAQGPKLKDMNLSKSNAGGTPSATRKVNVSKRSDKRAIGRTQ